MMTVDPLAFSGPEILGRGRWRVTLHNRDFGTGSVGSVISELPGARGRRLTQQWNSPAEFTFTLDGEAAEARLVLELATDVIAWRYDDSTGKDVAFFRGCIDHSEDQFTEEASAVTFTAHDYLAMLQRRILTRTYNATQRDQDMIAIDLIGQATLLLSSIGNVSFRPGSNLPLVTYTAYPDGSSRGTNWSGQLRDRTYPASTIIGVALDDLAKVIGGFDYDVKPGASVTANAADEVRLFYNAASPSGPRQGVTRTDFALMYGANVSTLARTVSSADYANYIRVLGNNGSSDPAAAQFFAEVWNSDANNVTVNPVGLWMTADAAADVVIQSTLNEQAAGDLNLDGLLVPSYTLGLTPGTYRPGFPNMGDTVPLIIKAGRLNVNTTIRVLGIAYAIGDDGDEDVQLTVGRSPTTLASLFTQADRDVDALTRR